MPIADLERDARVTAPSPWMFVAPPITLAVSASRTAFSGRFASTAVEDVALSCERTVALRASVRRHRRALRLIPIRTISSMPYPPFSI